MTAAIHLYANSLWLLWDSLLYFKKSGSNNVTLELDTKNVKCEFNYNETKFNWISKYNDFIAFLPLDGTKKEFLKPNGMEYTHEELFEMYEMFFNFLFTAMSNKVEDTYDSLCHTTLPEKFIAMCPKLSNSEFDSDHEDIFDFINFLCYLTKPISKKRNESGKIRKESTELLNVELKHKFTCAQCRKLWQFSEKVSAVNLIEFLQKK